MPSSDAVGQKKKNVRLKKNGAVEDQNALLQAPLLVLKNLIRDNGTLLSCLKDKGDAGKAWLRGEQGARVKIRQCSTESPHSWTVVPAFLTHMHTFEPIAFVCCLLCCLD